MPAELLQLLACASAACVLSSIIYGRWRYRRGYGDAVEFMRSELEKRQLIERRNQNN